MRVRVVFAVAALLALAATVQAQTAKTTDVSGALKKAGLNKVAAILDIANMTKPMSNPKAKWTLLAPDDAAVDAWLGAMGLSVDDLKARPILAKELAKQHLIVRSNLRAADIFDQGDTRSVRTMAGRPNNLLLSAERSGGKISKVTIRDFQDGVATVKGELIPVDENKSVHKIDRVLSSDRYYTDAAALCKARRLTISEFCDAIQYAGLGKDLATNNAYTAFVPNNAAMAKAKLNLAGPSGVAPKPAAVAAVLKNHVVKGARELPGGFRNDVPVQALGGANLTARFERVKTTPTDGRHADYAAVTVASGGGAPAKVIKSNVHVGKAVFHGIDAVLLPKAGSAPATATKAPAATPAATTKAGGRRLMAYGRHLLEFGWGLQGGGTTAEMDDAESDIEAAADGDESTADAAQQSLLGAEELSVPGDYNQVDNGINPW